MLMSTYYLKLWKFGYFLSTLSHAFEVKYLPNFQCLLILARKGQSSLEIYFTLNLKDINWGSIHCLVLYLEECITIITYSGTNFQIYFRKLSLFILKSIKSWLFIMSLRRPAGDTKWKHPLYIFTLASMWLKTRGEGIKRGIN